MIQGISPFPKSQKNELMMSADAMRVHLIKLASRWTDMWLAALSAMGRGSHISFDLPIKCI